MVGTSTSIVLDINSALNKKKQAIRVHYLPVPDSSFWPKVNLISVKYQAFYGNEKAEFFILTLNEV